MEAGGEKERGRGNGGKVQLENVDEQDGGCLLPSPQTDSSSQYLKTASGWVSSPERSSQLNSV